MKTESTSFLLRLRRLRDELRSVTAQSDSDLRTFLSSDQVTFLHRPKPNPKGVDVATTASVLMALAQGRTLEDFYSVTRKNIAREVAASNAEGTQAAPASPGPTATVYTAIQALCGAQWESSGLPDGNFFTTALALRAIGFASSLTNIEDAKHSGRELREIAETAATGFDADAAPLQGYPITPALGYWFFDAVERLKIELDEPTLKRWAEWSAHQFYSQMSHVVANDDAVMDPVAMAMAACLANKLRTLTGEKPEIEKLLPSRAQLVEAIPRLFGHQGGSGIWHKYFPLFIYPSDGLVNHCFTFELLEAVLQEFSVEVVSNEQFVEKLEKSVGWCQTNRLESRANNKTYFGWNSGSNVVTLRKGIPECWATAVVYMFLFKLEETLGSAIEDRILAHYRNPRPASPASEKWDQLVDVQVTLNGVAHSVKDLLRTQIMEAWNTDSSKKRKRSGLLFGPPGTSKTTLVKELAAKHGWPCISIDPSHFLDKGIERIYERANEIFLDLSDIHDAIVFFDEMDPLVTERKEGGQFIHQSLTTVFLPKLARLYEQNRVVFFMATNHFKWIDPAIKRPGRFDYHLCIGPPAWKDKLESLVPDEKTRAKYKGWVDDPDLEKTLDLYTYDELKALINAAAPEELNKAKFIEAVKAWGKQYIILWKDGGKSSPEYKDFVGDGDSKADRELSKRN
jgi:hypothetical protein